ncbi:hypothetical protein HKD37_05G012697 [Glycine soja]
MFFGGVVDLLFTNVWFGCVIGRVTRRSPNRHIATPPSSPPPPPPKSATPFSPSSSLATRPARVERLVVHVDLVTRNVDGPYIKKLRTNLGIVARDKVDVTYDNWKQVHVAKKDMIWEDIQFKSNLTSKWAIENGKEGEDDKVWEKYGISKDKWTQFCQSRRDPSWEDVRKKAQVIQKQNVAPHMLSHGGYDFLKKKLMEEKQNKRLEGATQSRSTDNRIISHFHLSMLIFYNNYWMSKSILFCLLTTGFLGGDILIAAIGQLEHLGHVRDARASIKIKHNFGPASKGSRTSSSILTQKIIDQLEESITQKVTQQLMMSFSQIQSQMQLQMQSQGLALPAEVGVGPSAAHDLETGDSDKCGLYVDDNTPRLVAVGRVYEGSTTVHNIPLGNDQLKVDGDARIHVPTQEAQLVGQTLNTFLAWPIHLVKPFSEQVAEGPAKLVDISDPDIDLLYLMTLTIPQLFLKSLQVSWDTSVFGVNNDNFPLYIKHEDLSKIVHGGECLSISVIQLWILQLCERGMLMCMNSSSHSLDKDLGNHSLNQNIILRNGCRLHKEMCT